MRHKKNVIIGVMCIAVLIMGLGYALLSTQIDISGSTAVTSTWKIEFSDIRTKELHGGATNVVAPTAQGTNASFEVDLVLPGDYVLYEIDITNYGDIDAEVKGATYNVSGSDAIYVYVDGIKKGTKLPSCEDLETCPTITLTLKVGYDKGTTTTITDKRKDIEFNIEVGQYVKDNPTPESDLIPEITLITLSNKIFANNNVYADNVKSEFVSNASGINFGSSSSDTNGKGLYYTSTNTENNAMTYYFRGNVTNNYVSFAGHVWRIVRVNEDGSVRLITQDSVGTSMFNTEYADNAYVGYMYGIPESTTVIGDVNGDGNLDTKDTVLLSQYLAGWESAKLNERQLLIADVNYDGSVTTADPSLMAEIIAMASSYSLDDYPSTARYNRTHANITDSTIKKYLDNWYIKNLKNYSDYLADTGFCGDRTIASSAGVWDSGDTATGFGDYNTNQTFYGPFNRWYNTSQPQFSCPNSDNDLFTLKGSSKGNKALTNPIGLLTADEMIYAGLAAGGNVSFQNYLNIGVDFWTMSPAITGYALMYGFNDDSSSYLAPYYVDYDYGVRPVINLKSCLLWQGGDGTINHPYKVSINGSCSSDSGTSSQETYTVSVSSNNTNYGTVSPSSQTVVEGGTAVITLSPKSGYEYSSNTCDGTVNGNNMIVSNVTANKNCTVTFQKEVVTLSSKILRDNTAYPDNVSSEYVGASTGINFGVVSGIGPYRAIRSSTNETSYFSSTYKYATEFTYDYSTGKYSLGGSFYSGSPSTMAQLFGTYKYTCKDQSGTNCTKMYRVVTASTNSSAWTAFTYSSENVTESTYNGEGLYYTSTNTEDNKPTYYFRGNVNNNYVQFGQDSSGNNLYWRIVRINEDGSVRIIYNGTSTSESDVTIGIGKYNDSLNDNAYVGYMYGTANSNSYTLTHSNSNSSAIKTSLDDWYVLNLSKYSEYISIDAGFCNDRSLYSGTGIKQEYTEYGGFNRLTTNKTPQFKCNNVETDLFTSASANKGNKKLNHPIGLITADEVAYAGGVLNSLNLNYYLYSGNEYWTISPHYYYYFSSTSFGVSRAEVYSISKLGEIYGQYTNATDVRIRPVINLQSTVELSNELPDGCTSLNGTASCPYIIKTN